MPREPAGEDAATSHIPARPAGSDPSDEPVTGAPAGAAESVPAGAAGAGTTADSGPGDAAGAGAAAGSGLGGTAAGSGLGHRAADASAAQRLREGDCLELERRLDRLVPPGATAGPAARAVAIRDENAAVRIYLDQLNVQHDEDAWRQLLDARTVYADALDRQAKSRTPAFYVAPRTTAGLAVTAELEQWSPAECAGPIHRLAAPEL